MVVDFECSSVIASLFRPFILVVLFLLFSLFVIVSLSQSRLAQKLKVITRSTKEFGKQTRDEMPQVRRNLDPELHPFAKEIEYTRALNASKMEKVLVCCSLFRVFFLAACHSRFSCAQMFAMPFVCALDGHKDGVFCMRRHAGDLKSFLSGSFDGGSLFCLSPFARVAC